MDANQVQWNLVIKSSDITKSYNKVILLVPALFFFHPDITRYFSWSHGPRYDEVPLYSIPIYREFIDRQHFLIFHLPHVTFSSSETVSEAGEYESALGGSRKRKRKKRRERSKKMRRDSDGENDDSGAQSSALEGSRTPTMVSEGCPRDADDGLSPQYQTHWYPESPRMSPGSYSGMHMASPPQHYPAGLSPPRVPYYGSSSPPHAHQPSYQFPSSMMSPPKSDNTSPGSSPTYFYDPSSPQKFFGYTEEIFSPVVSEASESDSSTSDTDNSTNSTEGVMGDIDKSRKDGMMQHRTDQPSSRALLEQATRKLSLSKDEVGSSPLSSENINVSPNDQSKTSTKTCLGLTRTEDVLAASKVKTAEVSAKLDEHSVCKSSRSSEEMPSTSVSSPRGPRTARVPSFPRTSFDSDADREDRDRTPSKDKTKGRRMREEEENIIRILQEMIHLHQVPCVLYITSAHSIQTLLKHATDGTKAQDRAHLLLKDILSSNFFFDKLVSRNIPYLIYRSLSFGEKQYEKTMSPKDREKRKESRSTHSSCSEACSNGLACSKPLEYLDLLREIAETTFGQKELEHILLGQLEENKFCAAVSVPYMFR